MKKFPLTTLAACLSVAWCNPYLMAADTPSDNIQTTVLESVEIKGKSKKDELGASRVYTRDTANLYKSRQEIETFKGSNVADILSGMSGVYSGEARNGGAVDPNIRGVQGEGRIPLTIDGTEQAITVWRGYMGVNNRNFLDPNIISSVAVEKGPTFNPAAKSGIGGNIAMKTLEVDDIVEPGRKWGVEVKGELGNNSIKPLPNIYQENRHYADYNSIFGTLGTFRQVFDGSESRDQRFKGKGNFTRDKAFRIAAATKQDHFEGLLAYAYRSKGNYFAGTKGADRYWYQDGLTSANVEKRMGDTFEKVNDPYIARIGIFVKPGSEISNTSLETTSYLAKGGFKPTDNSKINLGYRHTRAYFGDIMPMRIFGAVIDEAKNGRLYQSIDWPLGQVKQSTWNIDWKWKPENSRWFDMSASAWTTRTFSVTNTSGGWPGDVYYYEPSLWLLSNMSYFYNMCVNGQYDRCGGDPSLITNREQAHNSFMENVAYSVPDFQPNKTYSSKDATAPNTDGRFNGQPGQAYVSRNNRYGINFGNRMKLHDKLELNVHGMLQYEKLRSNTAYESLLRPETLKIYPGEEGKVEHNELIDFASLPRRGKRREGSFSLNFKYTPVSWLELNAGGRYASYSVQDDNGDKYYSHIDAGLESIAIDKGSFYTGDQVATPEQYALYQSAMEKLAKARKDYEAETGISYPLEDFPYAYEDALPAHQKYGLTQEEYNASQYIELRTVSGQPKQVPYVLAQGMEGVYNSAQLRSRDLKTGEEIIIPYSETQNLFIWPRDEYGKLHMAQNPVANGTANPDAVVTNPADPTRKLGKYYPRAGSFKISQHNYTVPYDRAAVERARKQKDAGWTPFFSATVNLTDNARLYARYHEFLRFPSMFEGIRGFSSNGYGEIGSAWFGYKWKPEHAKIFETGYVHDLKELLPKFRHADFRIGYYRNKTENILDRDELYNIVQFDKQIRDGVELQARFDSGRIFGNLGVSRSLRNEVCDEAYTYWASFNYERHPVCQNGSPSRKGFLASMIQPRWSVSANLGGRFFNEKLTLGSRFTYHSRAFKTPTAQFKSLGYTDVTELTTRWQPVAVVDAYVRYKFNKHLSAELTGNNLTNRYYLDPMARSYMPAPGRTIRLSITGKF